MGRRIKRKQFPFTVFFLFKRVGEQSQADVQRELPAAVGGTGSGLMGQACTILNVNYTEHPVGTEPKSRKAYNIIGNILISYILLCIDH